MSRSPKAERAQEALDEYVAGWRAVYQLLREGKSWSGRERNCAFLNCGGERFADLSPTSGLDFADDGRALAVVDWDHDGDQDVWLYNRTGPRLRLMINRTESNGYAAVSLRLRGTRSNRDAVGARVELENAGQKLVETVYAGDGFLSQSSKRLHFGLGPAPAIGNVTVRWPGGTREVFSGVDEPGRYLLVEGRGEAVREESRAPVVLEPSPQEPPEPPGSGGRLFLPLRVPMPALEYRELGAGLDGGAVRTVETGSKPLLVNFWASWCLPCIAELKELTARAGELEAAGLGVLALSVDGLDEDKGTAPADAKRLAESLGLPFEIGLATPELLDKLGLLDEILYDLRRPFGVPVSYLLAADGQLAASYRGRVDVDTLLADTGNLDVAPEELHALSVPLEGTWQGRLPHLDLFWIGRKFRERHPGDSVRYLEAALAWQREIRERWEGSQPQRVRDHVDQKEVGILLELAAAALERDDAAAAKTHLRGALEVRPDSNAAHNTLGQILRADGDNAAAARHYMSSLNADPADAEAHYGIGMALLADGDVETAFKHLRRASLLKPDSPAPLHALVWLIITYSPPDAVEQLREAVSLAEHGAEMTEYEDPRLLDALAAAYAEIGRFEDAVRIARDAVALARAEGDEEVAGQVEMRLAFYERGQPFREGQMPR